MQSYELIWEEPGSPGVMCVMLWCCAGPELQVRRGEELLLDEFYPTREDAYDRADAVRADFTGPARSS